MTATAMPAATPASKGQQDDGRPSESPSTAGLVYYNQLRSGYCKQCSDVLIDFASTEEDKKSNSSTVIAMPVAKNGRLSNGVTNNEYNANEETLIEELSAKPPSDVWRAVFALLFMIGGMSLTGVSLIFVHERVPTSPPLPDVLLTRVNHVPWALDVCEYLLLVTLAATYITAFLHRYRWIVLRRIFFMIGVLFAYRSVTIFVTALPSPSPTYYCEPKHPGGLGLAEVAARLARVARGGGFSINGNHVYCGDYIFSGHTSILTLGYLVIREYTSPRLTALHWTSCIVSITGVAFLVLSHGHYTIDIVLGYWVTTRLWWMYHTAANFPDQRAHGYFRRTCWWRAFLFFEAGRRFNSGPLPCEFDLPWPRVGAAASAFHWLVRFRHSAAELAGRAFRKLGLL